MCSFTIANLQSVDRCVYHADDHKDNFHPQKKPDFYGNSAVFLHDVSSSEPQTFPRPEDCKINFHLRSTTLRRFKKVIQETKKFFINIQEAAPLSQSSLPLYRRVIVWLTGRTWARVKRSRYGFRFAPCRPQHAKDPIGAHVRANTNMSCFINNK